MNTVVKDYSAQVRSLLNTSKEKDVPKEKKIEITSELYNFLSETTALKIGKGRNLGGFFVSKKARKPRDPVVKPKINLNYNFTTTS
jgi:hypothetical protein